MFNTAIVGCGGISNNHIGVLTGMDNIKIKYVCDIVDGKAQKASERTGAVKADFQQILDDPDIDTVHILTPHYLHAPMAIAAMKAGKDVVLEKPMAFNLSDADQVIRTASETGRRLCVCFQNRYNNTSVRMKELLTSGEAGNVLGAKAFVTWHRTKEYYTDSGWRGAWASEGGGVLINQSIHTLDLLLWMLGDVEDASGHASAYYLKDYIEVEDTAEAYITFKSGARALFFATTAYAVDSPVEFEIVCENLTMKLEGELTVKYKDGRVESVSDNDSLSGSKSYWGAGHNRIIRDFYECLESGKPIMVDPSEAIKPLEIISKIYSSTNPMADHMRRRRPDYGCSLKM